MKMRASATAREAGSGTNGMIDVDGLVEDRYVEGEAHELVQLELAMICCMVQTLLPGMLLHGESGANGGAVVAKVAESGRAVVL